jgi:hypothetical protein
MQCLFVRSNTILLASCTHKLSLLSFIQAEKKEVELCSKKSEGRNFQPNSFSTQFAAWPITQRWVELEIWFFRDYTLPVGVYHIQRALRLANPNQRYKPANLVPILLQESFIPPNYIGSRTLLCQGNLFCWIIDVTLYIVNFLLFIMFVTCHGQNCQF